MSSPSSFASTSEQGARLCLATEVKVDTDNIRDLLKRFRAATAPDTMRAVASTLIREISIACGAKELSLYNAFREHDLSSLAEHDLQAHRTVKKLASEAEASLSSTNWDYAEVLALAAKTFVAHARKEERDLPVLLERLTDDESEAEARRYLAARRNAPERPHPLMPQSGGLLHRAADMRNRAHDKVVGGLHRRPTHVDLMFKHGA